MIRRILYFAYGALAYLVFLATFLYAIAFVGGFAVPRAIDGAATTPFATALVVDLALLAIFAIQHSVMARTWFKRWWTQLVPYAIERSTYVLFASLALDLLFWQWRPLGGLVWSVESAAGRAVIWSIFAFGWLQVLAMTFLINHFDLFGLRQVWLHLLGRHYTRVGFTTPAPYRFVRHPLYLGFLLAFWAAPTMTVTHLVFAMMTTVYIFAAIQFEESDLVAEHGASYQQYRETVPMLLPIGGGGSKAKPVAAGAGVSVVAALAIAGFGGAQVAAQSAAHSHAAANNDLVRIVREATERFKDVTVAEREGYQLLFGCVSGPDWGAMGLHYVNLSLVGDDVLDPTRPEIVIYEPTPSGKLKLTGADFLVFAGSWEKNHPTSTPQLMGQLLHFFEAPNRFGLPPFYTLHVWAWKDNPNGTFVNWHPNVSCDGFTPNP